MTRLFGNKKGSEWISTILYVLISIAIIGVLMMAIRPRVAELKDKIILTQTVDSLNIFDETMQLTKTATGTNLRYNLQLSKGNFIIDSKNDTIIWQGDSNYMYSEINKTINVGRISALTKQKADQYEITLILDYKQDGINITFGNQDIIKTLNPASTPYTIWILNNGKDGSKLMMDLYLG